MTFLWWLGQSQKRPSHPARLTYIVNLVLTLWIHGTLPTVAELEGE